MLSPRRGWKAATVLNIWELVEEAPDVLAGEPLFARPGGGVQGGPGPRGVGVGGGPGFRVERGPRQAIGLELVGVHSASDERRFDFLPLSV